MKKKKKPSIHRTTIKRKLFTYTLHESHRAHTAQVKNVQHNEVTIPYALQIQAQRTCSMLVGNSGAAKYDLFTVIQPLDLQRFFGYLTQCTRHSNSL